MRMSSSIRRSARALSLLGVLWMLPVPAQESAGVIEVAVPKTDREEPPLDRVLNAIVARERDLVEKLQEYHPLVETYVQTLKPDEGLGTVPMRDHYFLGRLGFSAAAPASQGSRQASGGRLLELFKQFYAVNLKPDGFARMLVLDADSFDREHYDFEFVRREFLGEIRTLVFEVMPRNMLVPGGHSGRFTGRIWVEDRAFNIVRYNGVYASGSADGLHFDSWRLNMVPGTWFPAYVYTEESEFRSNGQLRQKHKGQTRIWGFELKGKTTAEEFTKVLVEAPLTNDRSETPGQISPVRSQRAWEREAEDNVLRRLQKGGLLAPESEVDQILQTVVTNLEVTNSLDIQPPVRCRVLLTTPLESFTVGHTIVVSRGLIDVLPDEASLAMVLAHELGHILLGHQLDTHYAFSDQMLVGDKQTMERFFFRRDSGEEAEADEKAIMLLESSPYNDGMGNAGLFLKALESRAKSLPALIRPHFGNRMAKKDRLFRMTRIVESAPELYPKAINQTAALPLGGRVKVDPWTGSIELMKGNRVALLSAREKMPFEVTPLMPYLARYHEPARENAREDSREDRAKDPSASEEERMQAQPSSRQTWERKSWR